MPSVVLGQVDLGRREVVTIIICFNVQLMLIDRPPFGELIGFVNLSIYWAKGAFVNLIYRICPFREKKITR